MRRKPPTPRDLLAHARELRRESTTAEQILWRCLRNRRLDGLRFRRQEPVRRYILDFYCPEARLAVELDGGQHAELEVESYDARRSAELAEAGIAVLRIWNHEIATDIERVLVRIRDAARGAESAPTL